MIILQSNYILQLGEFISSINLPELFIRKRTKNFFDLHQRQCALSNTYE